MRIYLPNTVEKAQAISMKPFILSCGLSDTNSHISNLDMASIFGNI